MLRFRATSIKKTSEMEFTGTPMTASLGTEVIRIRNAATAIGTSFIVLTMLVFLERRKRFTIRTLN